MSFIELRGVLPPMITPFTRTGDVDFEGHVKNINRWNAEDLSGYLVLGSNSETPYLTESEKIRLVELTVKHAAKGRTLLAGTGLESTRETIRFTNLVADLGVHAALILTPHFYGGQMDDKALVAHFREVAERSRIPVLIYNVPAYTRLMISLDAVRGLCEHPNIIGMKDSSGDVPRLAAMKSFLPPAFNLLVGTAGAWYPALTLGVRGGILALANLAGSQCSTVQKLFDERRYEEARKLYLNLISLNTAITSTYGIAGLKYAATLLGYVGGAVRSPLLGLDEQASARIRDLLSKSGLL